MSDNPVLEDLEVNTVSGNNPSSDNNPIANIASALETIFSEEHIDQKTNLTSENEEGLICLDVLQAHFIRSFKYSFPALDELKRSKQEHVASVNGWRSLQIVEIFKSIQTNIISGDLPLGSRLLGKR